MIRTALCLVMLAVLRAGFAPTDSAVAQAAVTQAADHNDRLLRITRQAGAGIHWLSDPAYEAFRKTERGFGSIDRRVPADRKALLDEALSRARARGRLVLLYVFRTAGGHMYRANVLDDYMSLAVFSDPETVALVNRKFVPIRLYLDRKLGASLGLTAASAGDPGFLRTVEPALVFLDPGGKVLHTVQRIRTFSSHWTRHVLKEVLRLHPDFARPSIAVRALDPNPRDSEAKLRLARERVLDGDEAGALELLEAVGAPLRARLEYAKRRLADLRKKPPGDEAEKTELKRYDRRRRALILRVDRAREAFGRWAKEQSRALRLLRRGREALGPLEETLRGDADADTRASVGRELARVCVALGEWDGVEAALRDAPESSESEFLRGAAHFRAGRFAAVTGHMKRAILFGGPPWNARAAAVLAISADTTSMSPLIHRFTMLDYGPAAAYTEGVPTTSEIPRKGTPAEAAPAVARAAFEFLLASQHQDGSWSDTRYAFWPAPRILPNVRVAVTALAATALVRWRHLDPARARAAVARAEAILGDDDAVARGVEEEVYSQAYRLLYWATVAAAEPERREAAVSRLEALARRAGAIQHPRTGLFTHEYYNAFCTAAMLWSLTEARGVGAEVAGETLARGAKALLSARRPDGTFVYGGTYRGPRNPAPQRENPTNLKNASARMPVCEGALASLGESDPEKLKHAFTVFLRYLDRLERVRKCDYHADGELGGFFFWHALFHAAEARRHLPAGPLRARVDAALLDLVTAIPEIDGSFVDDHEMGKAYGTAMGLLVLSRLRERGE